MTPKSTWMLARAIAACAVPAVTGGAALAQDDAPGRRLPFEAVQGMQQHIAAERSAPQPPDGSQRYVPDPADLRKITIEPALVACLERLNDPVYVTRETAMAELRAADFNNTQLYAALETLELTAEQRHRVLTVLYDRLLYTPRGAVGIKIDEKFRDVNKIVVLELLPDLPAREVLNVGDQITHLDGKELTGWDEFVTAIQSQPPGVKVRLSVLRAVSDDHPRRDEGHEPRFESLDFELELGSTDLLTDPQTGVPQTGGIVWERRKREAADAMRVWGPQPRPVAVEGG